MAGKSKNRNYAIGGRVFTYGVSPNIQALIDLGALYILFGDSSSYVTVDGANRTSQWNDLATTPANATQGTLADQPIYSSANKWCDFDTTDWLSSGNVAKLQFSTAFTMYLGFVPNSVAGASYGGGMSKYDSNAQRSFAFGRRGNKIALNLSADGGSGTNFREYNGNTVLSTGTKYLFCAKFNAGTATIYNKLVAETLTTLTSFGTVNSLYNSSAAFTLGSLLTSGAGSSFLNGKIMCAVAFNTAQSDADRTTVTNILTGAFSI